jgi:protein ImuB
LLPLAGAAAASTASAAANGSDSLWRPGEQGGAVGRETPALLERLRARLGHAAVHGLCLIPDHRPEASWRIAEPALPCTATAANANATVATALAHGLRARQRRRPLWLLATPRRLGALPAGWRLLDGPERIETGWWDGHDIARDYYLLRDADGAELWAFRDRQAPHDWFLHGVFG